MSDLRLKPTVRQRAVRRLVFIHKHRRLIAANVELAAHEMRDMGYWARGESIPFIVGTLEQWLDAIKTT